MKAQHSLSGKEKITHTEHSTDYLSMKEKFLESLHDYVVSHLSEQEIQQRKTIQNSEGVLSQNSFINQITQFVDKHISQESNLYEQYNALLSQRDITQSTKHQAHKLQREIRRPRNKKKNNTDNPKTRNLLDIHPYSTGSNIEGIDDSFEKTPRQQRQKKLLSHLLFGYENRSLYHNESGEQKKRNYIDQTTKQKIQNIQKRGSKIHIASRWDMRNNESQKQDMNRKDWRQNKKDNYIPLGRKMGNTEAQALVEFSNLYNEYKNNNNSNIYEQQARSAIEAIALISGPGNKKNSDIYAISRFIQAHHTTTQLGSHTKEIYNNGNNDDEKIENLKTSLWSLLANNNYDNTIGAVSTLSESAIVSSINHAHIILKHKYKQKSNPEDHATQHIVHSLASRLSKYPLLNNDEKNSLTNIEKTYTDETTLKENLYTLHTTFTKHPGALMRLHEQMSGVALGTLADRFINDETSPRAINQPTSGVLEDVIENIDLENRDQVDNKTKKNIIDAFFQKLQKTVEDKENELKTLTNWIKEASKEEKERFMHTLLSAYLIICKEENIQTNTNTRNIIGGSLMVSHSVDVADIFKDVFQNITLTAGGMTPVGNYTPVGILSLQLGGSKQLSKTRTLHYAIGQQYLSIPNAPDQTPRLASAGLSRQYNQGLLVGGSGQSAKTFMISGQMSTGRRKGSRTRYMAGLTRNQNKVSGLLTSFLDESNENSVISVLKVKIQTLLEDRNTIDQDKVYETFISSFNDHKIQEHKTLRNTVQQNFAYLASVATPYLEQTRKKIQTQDNKQKNTERYAHELSKSLSLHLFNMTLQAIGDKKNVRQSLGSVHLSSLSAGVALDPSGIQPIAGLGLSWTKPKSLKHQESLQGLYDQYTLLNSPRGLHTFEGNLDEHIEMYMEHSKEILGNKRTNYMKRKPVTITHDANNHKAVFIPDEYLEHIPTLVAHQAYKRYIVSYTHNGKSGILVPASQMQSSLSVFGSVLGSRGVLILGDTQIHSNISQAFTQNKRSTMLLIDPSAKDELGLKDDEYTNTSNNEECAKETLQARSSEITQVAALPLTEKTRLETINTYLQKHNSNIFDTQNTTLSLTSPDKDNDGIPEGTLTLVLKNNSIDTNNFGSRTDISYNSNTMTLTLPLGNTHYVFKEQQNSSGIYTLTAENNNSADSPCFSISILSWQDQQAQMKEVTEKLVSSQLPKSFLDFLDTDLASEFFLWMRYQDNNLSDGYTTQKSLVYEEYIDVFQDGLDIQNELQNIAKTLCEKVILFCKEHECDASSFGLTQNTDSTINFSNRGISVTYNNDQTIMHVEIDNKNIAHPIVHQIHGELSRTWMTQYKHLDENEILNKVNELLNQLSVLEQNRAIFTEIVNAEKPVTKFYEKKQELEKQLTHLAQENGYKKEVKYGAGHYNYDLLASSNENLHAIRHLKRLLAPDAMIMKTREKAYKHRRKKTVSYRNIISIDDTVRKAVEEQTKDAQAMFAPQTWSSSGTGSRQAGSLGLVTTYEKSTIGSKFVPHPTVVPGSFIDISQVNGLNEAQQKKYKKHYLQELYDRQPQLVSITIEQFKKAVDKIKSTEKTGNTVVVFPREKEQEDINNILPDNDKDKLIEFQLNENYNTMTMYAGLYGPCKNRMRSHTDELKYKALQSSEVQCNPITIKKIEIPAQGAVRHHNNPAQSSIIQRNIVLGASLITKQGYGEKGIEGTGTTEPNTGENLELIEINNPSVLEGISFSPSEDGTQMVSSIVETTINGTSYTGYFSIDNNTGTIYFNTSTTPGSPPTQIHIALAQMSGTLAHDLQKQEYIAVSNIQELLIKQAQTIRKANAIIEGQKQYLLRYDKSKKAFTLILTKKQKQQQTN